MSKYLVTGGAGFIGCHLVEELIKKGNGITIVDNLHSGSKANIKNYTKDIDFIKKDVENIVQSEVKDIDGIFHLGIYSSSPMYKENPSLLGKAINDFINMLKLSQELNIKMVWASTSSIYNGNPVPWKEDMDILVKDYYTEARYSMERLAKLHYDWYETKSIGLRFFSVYGPNERSKGRYANLISQFLWDMKEDTSPIIYGNVEQSRDFIYVDDVVKGLLKAFNSNIKNEIYNIGTGISYSLNEVVEIINNILDISITPTYLNNPIKGYVKDTLADISKSKEELGFEAKVGLKEGINFLLNE